MKHLSLFLALITFSMYSQDKNLINQPFVETSASVDTLVVPDKIFFSITLHEGDSKNKISVEELEKKMVDKLESIGINTKKQLVLDDLNSDFKKYFLTSKKIEKRKTYSLEVSTSQSAGKALYALEQVGISNVTFDRAEYSKQEQLTLILKSLASKRAKIQAEYLVKPLNQKIGNLLFISDNGVFNSILQGRAKGMNIGGKSASEEYDPLDIDFEKIRFTIEVVAKFAID